MSLTVTVVDTRDACERCGWPDRPERTPADDCPLFGDPEHDSLNCEDCWGICDALCEDCGRPVRTSHSGSGGEVDGV